MKPKNERPLETFAGQRVRQSLALSYSPPMFNQTVSFKGFIKASNSAGTKNMALVETSIVLPGTCAPNNGPWVNCQ